MLGEVYQNRPKKFTKIEKKYSRIDTEPFEVG